MDDETPLDLELHGYVDGTLDEESMARIEEYLRKHPETATKAAAYLQQKNDLITFASTVSEAAPSGRIDKLEKRLAKRLRRGSVFGLRSVAVVAALFAAGWIGHVLYVPLVEGPEYTDEIVEAHIFTSSDPEEVKSISRERVKKLFQRVGELERLPDLRTLGFRPVGAQLLPSDEGLVLQVLYRDDHGMMLSYFLLHDRQSGEIPQHVLHRKGVTLVYWQHDHSRYALAAPFDDEQVRRIATLVDTAPGLFNRGD